MAATELDQIVNLCKRRGFVYPSAEIYGGFRSSYDYGPLGSLMLRNVRDAWIRTMVQDRDDVVRRGHEGVERGDGDVRRAGKQEAHGHPS